MSNPNLLSPEAWAHLPPALSFCGIALATWVAEDLTLIASASLWAHGHLSGLMVFFANLVGISLGDMLLYALGRKFGPALPSTPWIGKFFKPAMLEKGVRFFEKRGQTLVLIARFVPGLRLPTYTAAGIFRAPVGSTTLIVVLSGAVWVPVQMYAVRSLGRHFNYTQTAFAAILFFIWLAWFLKGFVHHEWKLRWLDLVRWTRFEFWPAWFFYLPLVPTYTRLALKYRSWLLPTLADPGIDGGGLIGESKELILRAIPDAHPSKLKQSFFYQGSTSGEAVLKWAETHGLTLPLILKPDQGQRGAGVRLVHSNAEVLAYAQEANFPFMAQEYCAYEKEAGLFYAKAPWGGPAKLFSITDKRFPEVVGDGDSTVAALILAQPRARLSARIFFQRFDDRLDEVLAPGEKLRLVESGNHAQGALFLNGAALASPELLASLEALAEKIPGFFIGRFDVRYLDEASLKQGFSPLGAAR